MERFLLSLILLISLNTFAKQASQDSLLIGHNVTPTTETPAAGIWTLGTYAMGVGITDSLFIATSPWIWASYNTANLHVKYAKAVSEQSRLGLFLSYFHSYDSAPFLRSGTGSYINDRPGNGYPPGWGGGPGGGTPPGGGSTTTTIYTALSRYQWQSASLHGLYSFHFQSGTTLYLNLHYAYFWDDDFPYSIRMDPGSDDIRDQVDATALLSTRLGRSNVHWMFEAGGLGVNYLYPYLQVGTSLAYKSKSWVIQVGASYTAQFAELGYASAWTPGRYDKRVHYSKSENEEYYFRYLQTALHPEVQVQYFF